MFFRATLFGAFGQAKRVLGTNADGSVRALQTADFYKAGAFTGFVAAFTEGPIDFYKSQIQVQIIRQQNPAYVGEKQAARRQKWIDQAQSLNIYMAGASGKKLDETYKLAWLRGLKTTYYLRTMSATHAEKSTVHGNKLNAVSSGSGSSGGMSALDAAAQAARAQMEQTTAATDIKFCGVDDPTCEACQ